MIAARGSYEFFLTVINKPKEPLKKILDDIKNLTDEEIDSCLQPKWIKPHLKRYRREQYPSPEEHIENTAREERLRSFHEQKPLGLEKTEKYRVYRYIGDEKYIENIQADTGDYFQLTPKIIWWGSHRILVSRLKLSEQEYINNRAEYISDMTAKEYREFLMLEKIKKHGGGEESVNDGSLFTIF